MSVILKRIIDISYHFKRETKKNLKENRCPADDKEFFQYIQLQELLLGPSFPMCHNSSLVCVILKSVISDYLAFQKEMKKDLEEERRFQAHEKSSIKSSA